MLRSYNPEDATAEPSLFELMMGMTAEEWDAPWSGEVESDLCLPCATKPSRG